GTLGYALSGYILSVVQYTAARRRLDSGYQLDKRAFSASVLTRDDVYTVVGKCEIYVLKYHVCLSRVLIGHGIRYIFQFYHALTSLSCPVIIHIRAVISCDCSAFFAGCS